MKTVSTMGSGSLGRELDLETLVADIEKVVGPTDANFTNDSIVTLRFEDAAAAFTLYRTGTFQIRGAKSKENFRRQKTSFLAY